MSLIRNGLIALTTEGEVYGLKLRTELQQRTGRELNTGQVYSTLERAIRDGYIEQTALTHDGLALLSATSKGEEFVKNWFSTPEPDFSALVFQVRLALSLPSIAASALIETALEVFEYAAAADTPAELVSDHSRGTQLQSLNALSEKAEFLQSVAIHKWLLTALATAKDTTGWEISRERPKKGRNAKAA